MFSFIRLLHLTLITVCSKVWNIIWGQFVNIMCSNVTPWNVKICNVKCKGKTVPLQAWSGPDGSKNLRFPDFMTTAQDCGKVVSLTHRPPLPQEIHLVLISVRGWVDPRAIVWPEGLCHWKIPMTPSGNEPATCRLQRSALITTPPRGSKICDLTYWNTSHLLYE